jgi:hypothetical protein
MAAGQVTCFAVHSSRQQPPLLNGGHVNHRPKEQSTGDAFLSHPFDATLKDILGQSAADLTPILHLPADLPARALNVDLSTISAATDVAFGFGEPLQQIVDVNFQSGPDSRVDAPLLLYNAAYHHHYPVPVRSILILLRPAADLASLTGRLAYLAGGGRVEFEYEVVRLWVTVHGSNSMKSRGFCKAEGRFEPQNAHLRSRTP